MHDALTARTSAEMLTIFRSITSQILPRVLKIVVCWIITPFYWSGSLQPSFLTRGQIQTGMPAKP